MLAPPLRRKRTRSATPPESPLLPSPLAIFSKKRRRSEAIDPHWADFDSPNRNPSLRSDMPSAFELYRPAGERRRARQWDRLNAPSSATATSSSSSRSCFLNNTPSSFPNTSQYDPYKQPSSPISRWQSQPNPPTHQQIQMSSSPVRHQPPTSSPFRTSNETKVEEEWLDEEEMKKEWGEAYASQNSLLYTLVSDEYGCIPYGRLTMSPLSIVHEFRVYRHLIQRFWLPLHARLHILAVASMRLTTRHRIVLILIWYLLLPHSRPGIP